MARERYSIRESINRLLRLYKGETVSELPESLPPELLSEDAAWSDFVELLNDSLPGETLALPPSLRTAVTNAGFASGTASSLVGITGTSQVVVGIEQIVFGSGLSVSVTGTTVYLNA